MPSARVSCIAMDEKRIIHRMDRIFRIYKKRILDFDYQQVKVEACLIMRKNNNRDKQDIQYIKKLVAHDQIVINYE